MLSNGAYTDDFRQVIPIRLLIPEETLKTNDINQKRFTRPPSSVSVLWNEYWSVDAVTLEKKVAIVVIFTYRFVAFSSSEEMKVGKTKTNIHNLHPT